MALMIASDKSDASGNGWNVGQKLELRSSSCISLCQLTQPLHWRS
jgi:hypothetical protein